MLPASGCDRPVGSPYQFKPQRYSSHSLLLGLIPASGGGRRVLDLGCAEGYLSRELAARGYEVVAVDRPGTGMEDSAGVRFLEADLDHGLPPLDGEFSYIVCGDILEHLRDPAALLEEARPLLAPGGRLLASLPNSAHLYVRWNVLLGRYPEHDRGLFDRTHLHFLNWKRWVALLDRAGFQVDQVVPTAVPVGLAFPRLDSGRLAPALEGLSFHLARLRKELFAYQFVVSASAQARVLRGSTGRTPFGYGRSPTKGDETWGRPVGLRGQAEAPAPPQMKPVAIAQSEPARRPRVVVVMPAYNAEKTLHRTYADLPMELVDLVILVDDGSSDETVRIANQLGLMIFVHDRNYGYGANQKTCYREALSAGAEIVVMVHPDYQYDPTLLPEIVRPIHEGRAEIVLGSRLLGSNPMKQGMPWWKYFSNRSLTALENLVFGQRLSEYHTGYRAFDRRVLESVNFAMNSDGFIFDQEIMAQAIEVGARIAEAPVPTRYFPQASSASFVQSSIYGCKILWLLLRYSLHRAGWRQRQFESLAKRYRSASNS
jgi:SAM-dependent methyltransferase